MGNRQRTGFFYIVTIILSIISLEMFLQFIYFFTVHEFRSEYSHYYKIHDWGKDYYLNLQKVWDNYKFTPFVQWKGKEYQSKYININSQGIRKTWNPPISDAYAKQVYIFGGSTVWGEGARDNFTIPSLVSKILNRSGHPTIVTNYGEDAYVFPQEIIRLLWVLRDGHHPDFVVFYDGANDVYSAYQSCIPGTIQNLGIIKNKLEKKSFDLIFTTVIDLVQKNCMLYKLILKTYHTIYRKSYFTEPAAAYDDNQLKLLSQNIVKEYIKSMHVIDQLSKVYHFRYACCWQPVFFTDTGKRSGDGCNDPRLADNALAKLFIYVNASLKETLSSNDNNFVDLSDVLSQRKNLTFIDFVHITEDSNEVVAQKISRIIMR